MRNLAVALMLVCGASTASARSVQEIPDQWRFQYGNESLDPAQPDFDDSEWENVSVPHTWNRLGNDGWSRAADSNAERGTGWYRRQICAPNGDHRLYLQFDAASIVSDVWVNGTKLGRHEGAFSRFRLDATTALNPGCDNVLAVRADNSAPEPGSATYHVVPLSGDFMMYGGLYRPVSIITVDPLHIDLMDFGGPGIYAHVSSLSPEKAVIAIKGLIANDGRNARSAIARTEILDARGDIVAHSTLPLQIGSQGTDSFSIKLEVKQPHLWNGKADPYLYALRTTLLDDDGREIDRVQQPLGIRTLSVDGESGFLLNGQPIQLNGVSRHQDREDKGWAISSADHAEDMAIIEEIGANSVRLSHYNQSNEFSDLADRNGIMLWAELGLVNQTAPKGIRDTPPEMLANAKMQLTELIRQNYNHPSIAMWSIGNEVTNWSWKGLTPSNPRPLMEALNRLAKAEDPSRPTSLASCCEPVPGDDDERPILSGIADTVGFNLYLGWYGSGYVSDVEELGPHLTRLHQAFPGLPIALGEYGGGGAITQHTDNVHGGRIMNISRPQPEEIESYIHERSWAQISQLDWLFGSWVWQMFDATSDLREEGDSSDVNTKGLVTFDHQTRKDPFYFYQAAWRDDVPVLHLTQKRYVNRAYRITDVRAYSNLPQATLALNGQTACEDHICIWKNIRLDQGANRLSVSGKWAGGAVHDSGYWRYDGAPDNVHIRAGTLTGTFVDATQYGSDNFFIGGQGIPLNPFERELYADPDGEEQAQAKQVSNTAHPQLYQNYREGLDGYKVPVSNGRYAVTLHFFEPEYDRPGQRTFDVRLSGGAVRKAIDPFKQGGGILRASTIALPANVDDGTLQITFTPVKGKPLIAAIDIRKLP